MDAVPDRFTMKFWGVRGSLPVPGPQTARYGGNTACIEIRVSDRIIIIDAGSGAYALGKRLIEEDVTYADMLFTHTHLDHVCGLPFFKPAYSENCMFPCWAGHLRKDETLRDVLSRLMDPALFPVPVDSLKGSRLNMFEPGDSLDLGADFSVRTIRLNHPGGAVGYRIDARGRSIVIITDHEHGDAVFDAAVLEFIRDADVMVYDANFTDEEYDGYVGWGHSTWQEGLKLAEAANVQKAYMFHHAPHRTDDHLDRIAIAMAANSNRGAIATEGLTIDVAMMARRSATAG